jgi:GNAT superfamily N-acetyltransferase
VVVKKYRSQGIGKLIFDFLHKKAIEHNCTMLSLDSYTSNFKAHKFFYNEGYSPKGFHFINILQSKKVR